MSIKYDLAIILGRTAPLHEGHIATINYGLEMAEQCLFLCGSSNVSLSLKNPWSFEDREFMLNAVFHKEIGFDKRLMIEPLNDYTYNDDAWLANLKRVVNKITEPIIARRNKFGNKDPLRIGFMDFAQGHKSFDNRIINTFGWDLIPVKTIARFDATSIRNDYFRRNPILPLRACHPKVVEFLDHYMRTETFQYFVDWKETIEEERKIYGKGPFVAADALVTQSNHILLVERGGKVGKGQLAIPGGFVGNDETFLQASVRELQEETGISDGKSKKGMPDGVLKRYIIDDFIADDPNRSTRGKIISRVFHYKLPDRSELYYVKGADDAASAKWYPIAGLKPNDFFEDHAFIIAKMLNLEI